MSALTIESAISNLKNQLESFHAPFRSIGVEKGKIIVVLEKPWVVPQNYMGFAVLVEVLSEKSIKFK